jgi:hypothetical protein
MSEGEDFLHINNQPLSDDNDEQLKLETKEVRAKIKAFIES